MGKPKTKTHWLQSPNKNYLGHWDIPNGQDIILTIKSAKWESVKNPMYPKGHVLHESPKRVIRFVEAGFKPFICNQTNAQSIIKSTGVKYMEDAEGSRIQLFVGKHKDRQTREDVDCIRIRREATMDLNSVVKKIEELFKEKRSKLKDNEIAGIDRVLANEETLSYDKVLKLLKSK